MSMLLASGMSILSRQVDGTRGGNSDSADDDAHYCRSLLMDCQLLLQGFSEQEVVVTHS